MSDESFDRARELFDQVEPLPAAERQKFLDEHCADDPDLRQEVESLLAVRSRIGGFLDSSNAQWVGRRIGTCTIEGLISEGGMGVVLRAIQDKPRREVAVKMIKGPVSSAVTQQRFRLEAEALGRLDHPGIAHIFEAGIDQQGDRHTPYFVMEYIEGLSLLKHAEKLDLAEKLRLIIAVCEAVNHAHLRGVVHRDLKPSNIIVRPDGQPKVLDFGIARITDSDIQLTTMHTHVGQILGTLPYMSPEQVNGRQNELDLRSDVYSLGVLLFETLTSRLPQDLAGTELVEAARVIVDQAPAMLGSGLMQFPDDLETIVAKCLRKEPERRYQSAADLAADLQHFLNDEPILARPATTRYHLQKFAQRNRAAVIFVAVALTFLVAGLVTSLAGWSAASRSGHRAELAAAEARSLSDFLVDLIEAPDPIVEGTDVRVVDLLAKASKKAKESQNELPRVALRIQQMLSDTYRSLGLYPEAIAAQLDALATAEQLAPTPTDTSLVFPLVKLANMRLDLSQFAAADSIYVRLAEISPGLAPNSWGRFRIAMSMGGRYDLGGELEKAAAVLDPALADAHEMLGPEHVLTVDIQSHLGNVLWQLDEPERARDLLSATLATLEKEGGAANPEALVILNNLAMIYQQMDDYPEARNILTEALVGKQAVYGKGHPRTATGHHNLAHALRELGEYELALDHHRQGIAIIDTIAAMREPEIYLYLAGYGRTLQAVERFAEARSVYEQCYPPLAAAYGSDHRRVLFIATSLAEICDHLGDVSAAEQWRKSAKRQPDN